MANPPPPPRYPNRPVGHLSALAAALQISLDELQRVAKIADGQYRLAKPIVKADGSIRQPFDALPALKKVQRRIKDRLLSAVEFPPYLTGSIRGRDIRCNAEIHAGAKIVVCEDVASFFPSTSRHLVQSIWTGFFCFAPDVSDLLTALTTKAGSLPQGAITSSHLANLAFWNLEPALQQRLAMRGIAYSRYVDDITFSALRSLSSTELTWCIAQIYGMMSAAGMRAKRGKQEIWRAQGRMFATKVLINTRPALPSSQRQAIRTAVFQLEQRLRAGDAVSPSELNSVTGRVIRLAQFHPREATALKDRIGRIKAHISEARVRTAKA